MYRTVYVFTQKNHLSHFPTFCGTVSEGNFLSSCNVLRTYDFHSELWSIIRTRGYVFDLTQSQHPIDDFAEHDVFVVQEVTFRRGDEELNRKTVRK
jgi:hypothetical protein